MSKYSSSDIGVGGCLALIILVPIILALSALLTGWVIIVIAGILHGSVSDSVPAFGMWPAGFWLGFFFNLLFGGTRSSSN